MTVRPERWQTPSQTVGPFFHDALMRDGVDDLDPEQVAGTPIIVEGRITDGEQAPVTDAMVEVWQTDGAGRYRHPADGRSSDIASAFVGFGRIASDDSGTYRLCTVAPGTVPGHDGTVQAPHLNIQVFARGLLDLLHTRIYLAGHDANDADPVLATVPADRRQTLIAQRLPEVEGEVPRYRFDIVLQGPGETVFFDS